MRRSNYAMAIGKLDTGRKKMKSLKFNLFAFAVLALAITPSLAFGQSNTGTQGCCDNLDPNYMLVSAPSGVPLGPVYSTPTDGAWVPPPPGSAWINPYGDLQYAPGGNYDYQTTFIASVGTIKGGVAADNDACLYLNGVAPANLITCTVNGIYGFSQYTVFSFPVVVGTRNTLDFVVNNVSGPTGLEVEFTAPGQTCTIEACPGPNQSSVCQDPSHGCPSPQYRVNSDLTGTAPSDLLDCSAVYSQCLQLDFSNTTGGFSAPLGPTSSPSVNLDSRNPFNSDIIFAAQGPASSACGGGNVWGLWAYGTQGGNYRWDTITQGTNICSPIRSSPGLFTAPACPPTQSCDQFVFAGGEDGNLYAFGLAGGLLDWTFPAYAPIDSSPTVSPANEVYIVDDGENIYKVDGLTGNLLWSNPISLGPPFTVGANPPSSIALSTCGGQPCLIVVGGDVYCQLIPRYPGSSGSSTGSLPQPPQCGLPINMGVVAAFNTITQAVIWYEPAMYFPELPPITSSPVVSESQGLVYVQGGTPPPPPAIPGYPSLAAAGLYALDLATGVPNWAMPAMLPVTNASGLGTPAYDDSNKYVVVSANAYDCGTIHGITYCIGSFGLLAVYDGTRNTGGTLLCMSGGYSAPLFTYSSPTVAGGVIYIGTDDGHLLAYDESSCATGTLNLIWTSPPMTLPSGAPDPVFGPPVVSYDRVHVVTQSGTLYVYHLPNF